jgi:hypothetical protein
MSLYRICLYPHIEELPRTVFVSNSTVGAYCNTPQRKLILNAAQDDFVGIFLLLESVHALFRLNKLRFYHA